MIVALILGSMLVSQTDADYLKLRLKTEHYDGIITELCREDVACNHVRFDVVANGKHLILLGARTVVMCSDGVTPCHPVGYRFKYGSTQYNVSDEGELEVRQGTRVLLHEYGTLNRP